MTWAAARLHPGLPTTDRPMFGAKPIATHRSMVHASNFDVTWHSSFAPWATMNITFRSHLSFPDSEKNPACSPVIHLPLCCWHTHCRRDIRINMSFSSVLCVILPVRDKPLVKSGNKDVCSGLLQSPIIPFNEILLIFEIVYWLVMHVLIGRCAASFNKHHACSEDHEIFLLYPKYHVSRLQEFHLALEKIYHVDNRFFELL